MQKKVIRTEKEEKQIIGNIINIAKINKTNKIVLSGGDPLYGGNLDFTLRILKELKKYDICIYTGCTIEYVKRMQFYGFKYIKCGIYRSDLKQVSEKTDDYMQLASSNQNFYNDKYEQISENGRLTWTSII